MYSSQQSIGRSGGWDLVGIVCKIVYRSSLLLNSCRLVGMVKIGF